jgi:drug/metabolite transporter (DMT)-like permease
MKKIFIIHAILAALLFGLSTPFSKLLLNKDSSPIMLAALFYLGAALFLLPFKIKEFKKEIGELLKNKKDLKRILGAILFGGILGPVCLLYGIKFTSASSASLLLNMETVATSVLAFFIFKEHISKNVLISSILTVLAGVILVVDFNLQVNYGGLLIILACLSWGFDNNFTANVESISPTVNTIIKGLFAGTFNLMMAFIIGDSYIEIVDVFYALFIGFIAYGLSIVLYISSARGIGASRSQIIFAINPFLGSLISFLIFRSVLNIEFIIALCLMIIAVCILYYEKHAHEHTHHELDHTHEHTHDDDHHNHTHKGQSKTTKHTHKHNHKKISHTHSHYPDIHHKHEH